MLREAIRGLLGLAHPLQLKKFLYRLRPHFGLLLPWRVGSLLPLVQTPERAARKQMRVVGQLGK